MHLDAPRQQVRLVRRDVGQPIDVKGDDNMLEPAESLDSDEVGNDDGDEVSDPPDEWIGVDDNGPLDDRLAAEVPDGSTDRRPSIDSYESDQGVALGLVTEDDLEPDRSGRARKQ
jgi:hypothetical protein